jgi:glycosyltransferase involved in cell wall biosynthesis
MRLCVVNVPYALARVRPDSVGGAEQVIWQIDRELVRRGHRSLVIACEGSSVSGELVSGLRTGRVATPAVRAQAAEYIHRVLDELLSRTRVDVVHLHGHDFDRTLPTTDVPVLATLHLPCELTVANISQLRRPRTWIHGVSWAQHRRLPQLPNLLWPIENGVSCDQLARDLRRRGFALSLGRICPEKGFHLAIAAAQRANVPLLLAGKVFPYEAHQRYFEQELLPRLDGQRRFVGAVSTRARRRLLNSATCVVIPSLVQETSSLVAMEALACGTPVVAHPIGALPEIVEDGVTGFLVEGVEEMARAIQRATHIDAARCRERARARFSADRMVSAYLERYEWIVSESRQRAEAACVPATVDEPGFSA